MSRDQNIVTYYHRIPHSTMVFLPEALAFLLLTHVIGDYALQTDSVYKLKISGGLLGLAVHVFIHILITGMLLQFGFLRNWLLLVLLFLLHFTVDLAKLQVNTRFHFLAYLIDQFMHIVCILFLFWLFPQSKTLIPNQWLPLFLAYSLIPFVSMTAWVWHSEQQSRLRPNDKLILQQGFLGRMKNVSQITAIPLLLGVIAWVRFEGIPLVILVIERFN
ncbi:MAG: hypothetical protein ACI85U_003788 [Candidatus Promineifilaceae bacterium]|jgi:hypothetical protein